MTIVFKVSENVKQKMIKYYEDKKRSKTPPYAIFSAQEADTIITLYNSGKVMFQGISADIDANIWIDLEKHLNNRNIDIDTKEEKQKEKKERSLLFSNQAVIGSDEVGTGDYFGPIVVSAAYVDKKDYKLLYELGVKDSKKLNDNEIIKIAPKLIKNIEHKTYILNNQDYNKYTNLGYNLNKIKAILHNKVLYELSSLKKDKYDKIVVDQFCYPKNYFEYIKDSHQVVKNITFLTHSEDKVLSVAVASIISRYIFLKEIKKISDALKVEIPKGAGRKVDEIGAKICKEKSVDYLNNIAKLNFKNTQKILEIINS